MLSLDEIRRLESEPLRAESPFIGGLRVFTILEFMQRFNAVGLLAALGNLHVGLANMVAGAAAQHDQLQSDSEERLRAALRKIEEECDRAALYPVSRHAKRLRSYLDTGEMSITSINVLGTDLHRSLIDELAGRGIFQILPQELPYFKGEFFEDEIDARFADAEYDLDEAGKCFALGRYTATAFHLLRAVEVGLDEFVKHSNAKIPKNASWGLAIQACKDAGADADMVAHLESIKKAWRDPTMHVERRYNQERADEILAAVRAFMRHLARTI